MRNIYTDIDSGQMGRTYANIEANPFSTFDFRSKSKQINIWNFGGRHPRSDYYLTEGASKPS